ncbi:MAG: DNA polymerase III subunit chi [Desulfuromonadaceae bacterium]|nr:DNA polymerase III subunit chi [Desulfuromonadaceae bacterium]
MTKIDFIKLKKPEKAMHLCRLATEFLSAGHRVLVMVQDENQAVTLDRFMWTWKKDTFLPHTYDNGSVECLGEPVVIVCSERNPNGARILIMGSPCSVDFLRQFHQVIDFAEVYDDALAQAARDRYARYREVGFVTGMRSVADGANPKVDRQ